MRPKDEGSTRCVSAPSGDREANQELKRRVAELDEEVARLRTALHSVGDAVIVTDQSGAILQMNGVAESLMGVSEASAKNRPLPEVFRTINEDTRLDEPSPVEQVLLGSGVERPWGNALLMAKDGTACPIADRWTPLRDNSGNVSGVVVVFREQTEERRVQAAARDAEERFRAFFDNAPIGKSMTATDGRLLRVNQAFADMLSYSLVELQATSFATITHPEDVAESRECIRALLAGERDVWTMEKRYIAKDGHVVWTHVVTRLHFDSQARPLCFLTHIWDISDRKRTELALRESEMRQRRFFESGLLGVVYWNMDGSITDANDKFLEMIRYTREDLEAGRIDWGKMTPAEYRHLDIASVEELKATGGNRVPMDKVYVRKDGTKLPVTIAAATLDEKRTHGVAFVLDITERKRTEALLTEQQSLLRSLLESAGDAIFSVDHQSRYTSFNRQHAAVMKMLYGAEIELGHCIFEYQAATEDHVQAKRNIDRALLGEVLSDEGFSGSNVQTRAYFEVSHYPIRNDTDAVIGVAVFARDTTTRRRAEEELRELNAQLDQRVAERTAQLEKSNQELDAFSYSVSHDLRAPLRAIDGFTRILGDEYAASLDAEGKRLCTVVRDNTAKMSRLIDELLAFSRLGRAALSPTEIDMLSMANSVYLELTTEDNRARIDFQVVSLPQAVADPTLMRQIWVNLLSNAIKFSSKRERAEIRVRAEQTDKDTVFVVADNGAGFSMQYQDKLFGVFQRLHKSSDFEGTGVGLALVQRIIQRHGGRVWAESEVDRGATFKFTLSEPGALR